MDVPEYVTIEEVARVCAELGLRDWTALTEADVTDAEAETVRQAIGAEALEVPVAEFRRGLEVELEHGVRFSDANVTNNHPLLTGRIVVAHLKEMLDYYARLEVAELEGDVFAGLLRGDDAAVARNQARLVAARAGLAAQEQARLAARDGT